MILNYIPFDLDLKEYDRRNKIVDDKYSMFFFEEDYIVFITERNQKVLRDMILYYKPQMFYVESIEELNSVLSPTQISELIIFILNHKCMFISPKEDIFYNKDSILIVYPKIFEIFRKKIQ